MNGFSDAGSILAASTIDLHVIGEFIGIPHLAKICWLSGAFVCYGQDSHKIKKFERNGEFERALAEDGVGI